MSDKTYLDVLQDAKNVEALAQLSSEDEVKNFFANEGITLTDSDMGEIANLFTRAADVAKAGKITDSALDGVSGGLGNKAKKTLKIIGGVFTGTVVVAGAVAGGDYLYKKKKGKHFWENFGKKKSGAPTSSSPTV